MSDISDLKASVLEQAHEKGRLLLAEATEKIEQEAPVYSGYQAAGSQRAF